MKHRPVLLREALEFLAVRPDGTYVDATVGGGGHAAAIAQRLSHGVLIGLDCDPQALGHAAARLAPYSDRFKLLRANFRELSGVLDGLGIASIDGILFDLGVSSLQLDQAARGFSFRFDAPLDMRMDPELERTAADIIGRSSESELTKIFREYGEEPRARQIARAIVRRRDREPIRSTRQLAALIESEIPAAIRRRAKIHPATRIFQGLRIAVNDELQSLQTALEQGFDRLRVGGRLVVISFHSLEDRIVKEFLKQKARSCLCPPDFPVCRCNKAKELEVYGPITPTAAEVQANPRSRSAKLRAGIKIASRQGKA